VPLSPAPGARRRRQGQTLTPEQRATAQALFLDQFRRIATVTMACRSAGIHRDTVYHWLAHDPTFAAEYEVAEAEANDLIRGALFQRAVLGVKKPLHWHGQLVYDQDGTPVTITEYSDSLLMFLAKARMPTEFRDRVPEGALDGVAAGGAAGGSMHAIFVLPQVLHESEGNDPQALVRATRAAERAAATRQRVVDSD
jgi:hypothetical protein